MLFRFYCGSLQWRPSGNVHSDGIFFKRRSAGMPAGRSLLFALFPVSEGVRRRTRIPQSCEKSTRPGFSACYFPFLRYSNGRMGKRLQRQSRLLPTAWSLSTVCFFFVSIFRRRYGAKRHDGCAAAAKSGDGGGNNAGRQSPKNKNAVLHDRQFAAASRSGRRRCRLGGFLPEILRDDKFHRPPPSPDLRGMR